MGVIKCQIYKSINWKAANIFIFGLSFYILESSLTVHTESTEFWRIFETW